MLYHMLHSDIKIIYDVRYDILSYVVYYIIYELTVYGTDRNPDWKPHCDWKPHFKWWMLFKTLNSVKGY